MEHGFDALVKAIAESGSRRDMLKRVGAAALGIALSSVGLSCEPGGTTGPRFLRPLFDARGRCKKVAQNCRENSECCSDFCDPFTGFCACPSGTVVCSASGQCVPACDPPFVFNPDTCKCECPPPTVACGTTCANLSTDANNCGACGHSCNAPNTVSACVNGTCQVVSCNPGFANCDGNASNGCETNILFDTRNCGGCGQTCFSGETCNSGRCCHTVCSFGICFTECR